MDFFSGQNVVGWTVSEKLDGVFARWGVSLFTRDWVVMQAPAELTAGLEPCEGVQTRRGFCAPHRLDRINRKTLKRSVSTFN
ncbi:MAG: hypothetical protein WCL24_14165 [Verrucomicrobiota bacterium]